MALTYHDGWANENSRIALSNDAVFNNKEYTYFLEEITRYRITGALMLPDKNPGLCNINFGSRRGN